jgi:hypothetical protein
MMQVEQETSIFRIFLDFYFLYFIDFLFYPLFVI